MRFKPCIVRTSRRDTLDRTRTFHIGTSHVRNRFSAQG